MKREGSFFDGKTAADHCSILLREMRGLLSGYSAIGTVRASGSFKCQVCRQSYTPGRAIMTISTGRRSSRDLRVACVLSPRSIDALKIIDCQFAGIVMQPNEKPEIRRPLLCSAAWAPSTWRSAAQLANALPKRREQETARPFAYKFFHRAPYRRWLCLAQRPYSPGPGS